MSNSFRTKNGRVIIDGESLRIERAGRGWLTTVRDALTNEETPGWRRAAVVLFYLTLFTGAVLGLRTAPPWISGAVVGLLLAAGAWSAYLGRNGKTESLDIPLEKIVDVEARTGLPLLTRPRFVVRYRSEGGVKHRYLLCPSQLYGFQAYEAGTALFDRHGLLTAEAGAEDEQTGI